jgi:YD repeat-containing protein
LACLAAGLLAISHEGNAGQERYDYDPIGRLTRWVDSQGQVTEYTYDPAGNILSVTRGNAASQAPLISSITPTVIRAGQTATLTVTGQRLQSGTLQAADPGIDLANIRQSATQVLADMTVAPTTPTGTQTLIFSNSVGSASAQILIAPKLPTLTAEPNPLALPPDNVARAITLRLSSIDLVGHTISASSNDTSRATVSPGSVTIAAGQATAQVQVTPKLAGFVSLTFSSPTLGTTTVPLFVTSDFRGVNTSHAQAVGVVVGQVNSPSESVPTTVAAQRVGITVGPMLTGLTPSAMHVGSTRSYTLTGRNLPAGTVVSLLPPQEVSVQVTGSSAESISFDVTATAQAAVGMRRVVVTDGAGALVPFAEPSRSQIQLTTGEPTISSIEPLFAPRNNMLKLKVRGTNLQHGRLKILPSIDIQLDTTAQVNAEGTELVANAFIAQLAAPGPRVVQVQTPSGETPGEASSANTFVVASEVRDTITPIFAPLVGVSVGSETTPETRALGPVAARVGVTVGAFGTSVTPSALTVGTTATLVVTGAGLQAVQSASFAIPDGLSLGTPVVDPQGTSLSIPVAIGADAPRGLRRLVLSTAAGLLPFTYPGAELVRVANPSPEMFAVAPQVVPAGQTVTLTVTGRNFTDLTAVRLEPPAGATITGFSAASSTSLNVTIQAHPTAATGLRTLVVEAAGGSSDPTPLPSNSFQIAQQVGPTLSAIFAPAVGVLVQTTSPQVTDPTVLAAPLVGVLVTPNDPAPTELRLSMAPSVGVVVGTAVRGLQPRSPEGFMPSAEGTLTIQGFGLESVTSVIASRPGVTLGVPNVQAGGTELTVPITMAANAPSGTYWIGLFTGSGASTDRVTALDGTAMTFDVGALPTGISSVSPIVLEQGKSYTFTVRGTRLQDVYRIEAFPGSGVVFGPLGERPQWSTDSFGEKLAIPVQINGSADIGSRVIRLRVPGGITDAQSVPANTITIVAPQ